MKSDTFGRLEFSAYEQFLRIRKPILTDERIVFVEIAGDSVDAVGRFPWPRAYHAVLVQILKAWGAKAIVFDMIFRQPGDKVEDDQAFAEAIADSGRVYLPVFRERMGGQDEWLHNLPLFENNAKGVGHINIDSDEDGVLRRVKPRPEIRGESYPYLGIKVAMDVRGIGDADILLSEPPLDADGNFMINWAGRWVDTFQHYSYFDVFKSYQAVQQGIGPIISPDRIKGKIVLIGVTSTGGTDIHVMPMENNYPGVGVMANVLNSVLTRQYIRPAPFHVNALWLIVLGIFSLFLFIPFRSIFSTVGGLILGLLWLFSGFLIFSSHAYWLKVAHPLVLVASLYLVCAIWERMKVDMERLRLFTLAMRDDLTGLYVRRYFQYVLARAMRRANEFHEPLSLVLIDIDQFKDINDSYGHPAGDFILKETARALEASIRVKEGRDSTDCVARYAGDEFIVMLPCASLPDAVFTMAERIRKAIEKKHFSYEGIEIPVTISLGVAALRSDDTVEMLIKRTDDALYQAKREGRNRTCLQAN